MTAVLPWRTIVHASKCGDNLGFCIKCGEEHYGIEPDARRYICEYCGEESVYGVDEFMLINLEDLE